MPRLTVARVLALLWLLLVLAILLPYGLGGFYGSREEVGGYQGSIGASVEPVEFKVAPLRIEESPRILVDIEPKHEGIEVLDPFTNYGLAEFELLFRPWLDQDTLLSEFQLAVEVSDSTIHSTTSYISGGYYVIEAIFTPSLSAVVASLRLKAPSYNVEVYYANFLGLDPGSIYRVTFKTPYQHTSTHEWEGQTITAKFTPIPPLRLNTNFYQAYNPFEIWAVIVLADSSSLTDKATVTTSMPVKDYNSVQLYVKVTLSEAVLSVKEVIVFAKPSSAYSNALANDLIAYPVFIVEFENPTDLGLGFVIEATYTLSASP